MKRIIIVLILILFLVLLIGCANRRKCYDACLEENDCYYTNSGLNCKYNHSGAVNVFCTNYCIDHQYGEET